MDTSQQGRPNLLAGISLVSLSFVFMMCSVVIAGVVCVISIKIKKMKRNIEVLMRAKKNTTSTRVQLTSDSETLSNTEARAGSDTDVDSANYAIPFVGLTVSAEIEPTSCAQSATNSNTPSSGKAFQMDDNAAYEHVTKVGGGVKMSSTVQPPVAIKDQDD